MKTTNKWKLKFREEIVENGVDEKMYHFYNRVEKFIENLLFQHNKDLTKKIKGMKVFCSECKKIRSEDVGKNEMLDDILSLLEESGKKI